MFVAEAVLHVDHEKGWSGIELDHLNERLLSIYCDFRG